MSQTENAVTSSSDVKRAYRKDKPLSEAERQRAVFARKRAVCGGTAEFGKNRTLS
ncbi:TPA: hypothetical protein RH064_004054 [Escherichia coli]|nr:hypothetical protein [Escherichia coli]